MQLVQAQASLIRNIITNLDQANADTQFALPAGDLCYSIHSRLEDIQAELEDLLAQSTVV